MNMKYPCAHLSAREHLQGSSRVITLLQACNHYLRIREADRAEMLFRKARRKIDSVVNCLLDRTLYLYKTSDTVKLRH